MLQIWIGIMAFGFACFIAAFGTIWPRLVLSITAILFMLLGSVALAMEYLVGVEGILGDVGFGVFHLWLATILGLILIPFGLLIKKRLS